MREKKDAAGSKICIWGWGQEFARPVRAGQEDGVEKREPEWDRKSCEQGNPKHVPTPGPLHSLSPFAGTLFFQMGT